MSQQHFAIREASGAPGYKHRSSSSQEQTCYQGMTLTPRTPCERTAKSAAVMQSFVQYKSCLGILSPKSKRKILL